MDAHLPAASLLGRALLRLARARATGTLTVQGPARARFALHAGRIVAAEVPGGPALGDLLGLDPVRHREAFDDAPPAVPIGRWLIDRGLASRGEIAHALRRQLRARMALVFGWRGLELRFDPVAAPLATLDEPVAVVDLVLGALREVTRLAPTADSRLREGEWTLTTLGRALLPRAELFPEERAMLVALERRSLGAHVIALGAERPRAARALYAWQLVGLVAERTTDAHAPDSRHLTLLRKRNLIRRGASPESLVAAEGGDERAMRRVLRDVHPDRFDPRLRDACGEVLRELIRARNRARNPR